MITPEKKEYNKLWRQRNKIRCLEYQREWRRLNPEKVKEQNHRSWMNWYYKAHPIPKKPIIEFKEGTIIKFD